MEGNLKTDYTNKESNELLQNLRDGLEFVSEKETMLIELVKRATIQKDIESLNQIIGLVKQIAGPNKITLAKLFKTVLDAVSKNDDETKDVELEICRQILDWSERENKTFLKTKLIIRTSEIYLIKGELRRAKEMIDPIIAEAQSVDDKPLLIESQLLEAKILASWQDWPKAKSSLSSCRAAGSKIYVAPSVQSEIEAVSGAIHLAEKDYQIACSYFVESLEGFHQQGDKLKASKIFRHLLIAKILMDNLSEAQSLINGRHGENYARFDNINIVLLEIFEAYKEKSLIKLSDIFQLQSKVLKSDLVVFSQLESLYGQLLESNIFKLIKPYSSIQLSRLCQKLHVPEELIERKLCELIIDQKLRGSIDQDQAILILFPEERQREVFDYSLEIMKNMDNAITVLFERATKLEV